MKITSVSIAEGKKGFSRLIQDTLRKKDKVIITKRGKPVVVIIPYEEYQYNKRLEGFRKIAEARETFRKAGVSARQVFINSKKQLEERP